MDSILVPRRTAILLLALCTLGCGQGGTRIHQVQGPNHRSPFEGQEVRGVTGVVTAVDSGNRNPGFWIEEPDGDGDDATSEGLFVATGLLGTAVDVRIGQVVEAAGRVEEHVDPDLPGDLSLTRLLAEDVRIVAHHQTVSPVRLGRDGRRPPSEIDDDGLQSFDPTSDAIDFYESLEGMRVEIAGAVVVGATSRFGEIVVLADGGDGVEPRSGRGGVLMRDGDDNPERLVMAPRLLGTLPPIDVGDRFASPIVGVVDYSFSNFQVLPTGPLPGVLATEPAAEAAEATALSPTEHQLTLATFNVFNLSARDGQEKLHRLATTLVRDLAAPDVVALQEVQDDNGPEDDGVVGADATFGALIDAVVAAGGPRYQFRQINPVDGADGGQPGANIRVGLLVNPERAGIVDRGRAGPLDVNAVEFGNNGDGPNGLRLAFSPGRVAPLEAAFEGSRKPLACELLFQGHKVFVVVAHLNSKRTDDSLMGARQPPQRPSEARRTGQARLISDFMERFLELDAGARVVVLGDMNEFEFRPPIESLRGSRWTDLIDRIPLKDRYTFNFNGNSQTLDHVLISPALAAGSAPEVDVVHVNVDRAHTRRSSDHDPVVVRLTLE